MLLSGREGGPRPTVGNMAQAWSPAAHDREDQLHVGGIGILMLGNAYQNGSGQCPMSPAALQKLAPSESPEHGLGNNRNNKISEESRVGKESVRKSKYRWSPNNKKKKN